MKEDLLLCPEDLSMHFTLGLTLRILRCSWQGGYLRGVHTSVGSHRDQKGFSPSTLNGIPAFARVSSKILDCMFK